MDHKIASYFLTAEDSWEEHNLLANISSYIPEIAAQMLRNKSKFMCKSDHRTETSKSENQHFDCQFCSEQFGTRSSLNRHLTTHSSEKPFKCEICSLQFTQERILRRHLTAHSGEILVPFNGTF